MHRFEGFIVVCALFSAGCASAPEQMNAQERPQATLVPNAEASQPVLEPFAVDAAALNARGRMTCRDVLKAGSNVIVTHCFTEEDWKRFRRQQTMQAQETLRVMQGGGFR